MRRKICIVLSLWGLVIAAFSPVAAQQPSKEYRFIASSNSNTLEEEINDAAKEGFRLHLLSDTFADAQIGAVMVRANPGAAKNEPAVVSAQYEYKVLGARKVATMRKELEGAALQGYELRGMTANASVMVFTVSETISVLERPVGQTSQRYEYRFLTSVREKELQKSLDATVAEGFHPTAISVNKDNNAASFLGLPILRLDLIMQRQAGATPPGQPVREYRFLSTLKPGTFEKEIKQLSKEGWRFHQAGLLGVALMARDLKAKPEQLYEYQVLIARRTGTVQKELQEAGGKGWTYRGASGIFAILEQERNAQNPPRGYKLLATMREKTTRKELDEAVADGHEVIDLVSIGEYVLILERKSAAK